MDEHNRKYHYLKTKHVFQGILMLAIYIVLEHQGPVAKTFRKYYINTNPDVVSFYSVGDGRKQRAEEGRRVYDSSNDSRSFSDLGR